MGQTRAPASGFLWGKKRASFVARTAGRWRRSATGRGPSGSQTAGL